MTQFTRTWVESQNAKRRPVPAAPPKADAKAEKELQRQIITWLEQHRGIVVGYSRMDKRSTYRTGWPDLVFVYTCSAPGPKYAVPVALEVKTSVGALTDAQFDMAKRMIADGWRWHLVRSLDEVRQLLDEIERGR